MIKIFFKVTLRYLFKNKGYAFINIARLALGIACCILISIYVINEMSYDKHNSKAERIYRVKYSLDLNGVLYKEVSIPFPGAAGLVSDFHEVENAQRIYKNTESTANPIKSLSMNRSKKLC